jgi:DNA-binding XRE family transcriptional regulator
MMLNLHSFGQHVKEARLQAGISQAELAKLAHVSRATINTLENGAIKEIGVNRLARIITAVKGKNAKSASHAEVEFSQSHAMQLSFPYDWSNPDLADEVLIYKVIERGLFEDIVRVCLKFGLNKVSEIAASFITTHPLAAASTHRMLHNISQVKSIV